MALRRLAPATYQSAMTIYTPPIKAEDMNPPALVRVHTHQYSLKLFPQIFQKRKILFIKFIVPGR
jgi:hypothetical protein